MTFALPRYTRPNLEALPPIPVRTAPAPCDGAAPECFHATTIYPEFFYLGERWRLLQQSRMDCVVVVENGQPMARELRTLRAGEQVVIGRSEDGSKGIYVDSRAFCQGNGPQAAFRFRSSRSRETAYSQDYDRLYELLAFEREHGNIVWVLGPAVVFDSDARSAMAQLIAGGYVHALLAGNALATHDLEAALFGTALGQDIYSKSQAPQGHYHHLDAINASLRAGSIAGLVAQRSITDGVVAACIRHDVPLILAGSIRDDGPLPGVIADAYAAQDTMRAQMRQATTVLGLATQLHTIAVGNMTPSYQVIQGQVRPVYFYAIDISEFATNKLRDRGSLGVIPVVTNVQDFVVLLARHLCR